MLSIWLEEKSFKGMKATAETFLTEKQVDSSGHYLCFCDNSSSNLGNQKWWKRK